MLFCEKDDEKHFYVVQFLQLKNVNHWYAMNELVGKKIQLHFRFKYFIRFFRQNKLQLQILFHYAELVSIISKIRMIRW